MYTGITQGLFDVTKVHHQPNLTTYTVELSAPLIENLVIGSSVSIDGVCQTVTAIHHYQVTFQAIAETLQKTTLATLIPGQKVSVERSAYYGKEIGGHELAGHIFETGRIIEREVFEHSLNLLVQCSKTCFGYLFEKGFIGINGSSLTLGRLDTIRHAFYLHLIPETLRVTNLGEKMLNDHVNIEIDAKTMLIVHTIKQHHQNIDAELDKLQKRIDVLEKKLNI